MKLSAFFHSYWCERSDTTCMRYSWMTGRALLKTKMSGVWNAAPLLRGCLIFRGLANQFPAFAITAIYQYLTGYERSLWLPSCMITCISCSTPASKTQSLIVAFKFIPARCATIVSEASHTLKATLSLGRSSEQGFSSWKQNGEQGRLGNSVLTHPWLSSCVAPAGLAARL
jgi:hypothetical protein